MIRTPLSGQTTTRLIPHTHHKPPVLQPLIDTKEELEALARLEAMTSGRLTAEQDGTDGVDPRELVFSRRDVGLQVYGATFINAAFTYTRATGNRFNGSDRGAWYSAFEVETSIAEVGFHLTRELTHIGDFNQTVRYVELLADFVGEFPDVADETSHAALHTDPAIGYPAGQQLAVDLRRAGDSGLLYPSLRRAGGRCFVAFDPHIVQNVRPGAHWNLVWDGSATFSAHGI